MQTFDTRAYRALSTPQRHEFDQWLETFEETTARHTFAIEWQQETDEPNTSEPKSFSQIEDGLHYTMKFHRYKTRWDPIKQRWTRYFDSGGKVAIDDITYSHCTQPALPDYFFALPVGVPQASPRTH